MSRVQKRKQYNTRREFWVINTPKNCNGCKYENILVDGVKPPGHCYMFESFQKGCQLNEV